ncbi:MAG: ACT domain-containing protein [Brachybacterium sp.]|nr:ACT domain-containing protein [Brachybacterium sp.]
MAQLVLTAIGDDREGLVSSLAEQIDAHGGNWQESALSHLAGKFAGVVLVEVPGDRVEGLTSALAELEQSVGLRVDVTDARDQGGPTGDGDAAEARSRTLTLQLIGQDRTGMVHDVTSTIASFGASIEDLRTRTADAPEGGGVLFMAEALVHLPAEGDEAEVRDALEKIAAELMVDLDLDDAF